MGGKVNDTFKVLVRRLAADAVAYDGGYHESNMSNTYLMWFTL